MPTFINTGCQQRTKYKQGECFQLGFGSNKSLLFFRKVCKFYFRTDRALPIIRCMDQMGGRGGGGGGGGEISPYRPKIMAACVFLSSSRFRPSLTGLVVHARQECVAMAKMTWSLQVDLVSVTQQPPVNHNLFNQSVLVILHTMIQQCGPNVYGTCKILQWAQPLMALLSCV